MTKTGRRGPDGHCSVHGYAFVSIYDDRLLLYDCTVCANVERLEQRISQLYAALEHLGDVCREQRDLGKTSVALEAVIAYVEEYAR